MWFVFDIHKPALNSRWFETAAFERDGRVYAIVGVPWFVAAQQRLGWNSLIGVPSLARNEELWEQREWGTRFGEATHWVCLFVLIPIAGWTLVALEGTGWVYWLASAIVLHLYPIMLQRYLRPRFRRLVSKMRERTERDRVTQEPVSQRGSRQAPTAE